MDLGPHEPSPAERRNYYNGMLSRPILIARTSSFVWVPPLNRFSTDHQRRDVLPVESHPIIVPWNTRGDGESVRGQIIQALTDARAPWTSINIFRVGDRRNPYCPVTMIVGVDDKEMLWSRAVAIALACRHVLMQHGFVDVHCEIMQSRAVDFAENSKLTRQPVQGAGWDLELEHCTTEYLGNQISPMAYPTKIGSVGLYLQLDKAQQGRFAHQQGSSDDPEFAMLTCRHVLVFGDYKVSYTPESLPTSNLGVILPTAGILQSQIRECQADITIFQEYSRKKEHFRQQKEETGVLGDRENGQILAGIKTNQKLAEDRQAVLERLQEFERQAPNIVGDIIYAQAMTTSRSRPNWIPDWALAKLNPAHFEGPLAGLTNQVYLGSTWRAIKRAHLNVGLGPLISNSISNDSHTITLRGTIPVEELTHPKSTDEDGSGLTFVMKRGPMTGLTSGRGNKIMSVLLKYNDYGLEQHVLTWSVIGLTAESNDKHAGFSAPGDSGSAVFGIDGRVAGIVTAGMEGQETIAANDVTYVSPIEWIFQDMREHGLEPKIMCDKDGEGC